MSDSEYGLVTIGYCETCGGDVYDGDEAGGYAIYRDRAGWIHRECQAPQPEPAAWFEINTRVAGVDPNSGEARWSEPEPEPEVRFYSRDGFAFHTAPIDTWSGRRVAVIIRGQQEQEIARGRHTNGTDGWHIDAFSFYPAVVITTRILALPAATGTPEERRATLERAFDSNAARLAYNYGAMRVDPACSAILAALTDAISDQWHEAVDARIAEFDLEEWSVRSILRAA